MPYVLRFSQMHMYLTQSNYQKEPKSSDFGESESDLPKKIKNLA